ncbi:hypothetical protein RIF29_29918 [Crotalaria pallida]|uniref:DUF4218 domain-containing protein n=1 Tax=Crotalaria pallida TaxID=3830 RepID=A0AAN9EFW7_CROPI
MPNSIPPSPNSSSSSSSFHSLSHSSYSSLIFIFTFFFFYSLSLLQTQVQSAAEEIANLVPTAVTPRAYMSSMLKIETWWEMVFHGSSSHRGPPIKLTGSNILKQLEAELIENVSEQWRKNNIFNSLPYWETQELKFNLDPMHIEKNVHDNVTYTMYDDTAKTKDNLKARKDLREMGIRKELWPDENGRYCPSVFTMSNAQKDVSLRTLINVKVPDGYSRNISCCIDAKKRKFVGMKSHDCHILMEHLLPLAIRNVLPDKVTAVLIELCSFFRQLCSKTLNSLDLDKLQSRIILTLCHLEMLFPPSFFTIMVHLTCHLVDEAKLGGPVQYRWMYLVERYLGHLKSLVRNKAQPEGSIAQGYLAEEVLTFCSQYLEGIETRINRPARVNDDTSASTSHPPSLFPPMGEAVGAFSTFELSTMEKIQAHRYVLLNCPAVKPYIDEFKDHVRRRSKGRKPTATQLEKIVSKDFIDWFPRKIMNPDISNNVLDDLKFLAKGPTKHARRFSAFNINGFKFRTTAREVDATTQNNGVFLTSSTSCVASGVDGNVREADLPYYGKLEDIIELNYYGKFKVTLFKCQWADTTRDWGIRKDKWGFTSINFSRLIHNGEREDHDPYIEASQAQMVYYVEDEVNKGWSVVVHVKPRDLYDMGEQDDNEVCEIEPCPEQDFDQFFGDINDLPLVREDAGEEFLSEENDINDIDMPKKKRINNLLKSVGRSTTHGLSSVGGSCSHAPSPVAGSSSHDPPQVSPPQLSPHSPSVDPAFSEPFSQLAF